ncbi:hypothetical protein NIES25_46740 [Nostoc linckia NIES-25]|nr:hypothetical protein NIES25_46740 [Nostoc linckia NIES-25]
MHFEEREDKSDRVAAQVQEDLLIQLGHGGVKVKVVEINKPPRRQGRQELNG